MRYSFPSLLLAVVITFFCTELRSQQDPLQIVFTSLDSTSVLNGQVDVEVHVIDFDDIVATQFTVLWDSTVLEIVDVPFISQDLPGLNIASFSLPFMTASMTKGQMAHTWFSADAQAKTLPNDHHLFTMRFKAVGEECSSTSFELLDTLTYMTEITNGQFENISAVYNHLPILITGTDCGSFVDVLACNDMVDISLSQFPGDTQLRPQDLLEGGPYDYSVIDMDPMFLNCDNIGDTITVTATHRFNGNSCWGNVVVHDLSGAIPVLDEDAVVQLSGSNSPDPFTGRLNIKDLDEGSYDNCTDASDLVFAPEFIEFDCTQLGDQEVSFTITDLMGNVTNVTHTVSVELEENVHISCPLSVVVDCGSDINDEEFIDEVLGRATSTASCMPVYQDIFGLDQNGDGDMDDEYTLNGQTVIEDYLHACDYGTVARIWSVPGSSSVCRQIIALFNNGSSFEGETMIDWPYSLNSFVEVEENDGMFCNTECVGVHPDSIEIIYDNGLPVGANVIIECEEALCEEPYWLSSDCSFIGWASETELIEETDEYTSLVKTYYVIDACQFDSTTMEGRWSWTVNATLLNTESDAVKFNIPDLNGHKGETVCFPVEVENFEDIESVQASISWDADIAQYSSVAGFALPGFNEASFGLSLVSEGKISFVWFDATTISPSTLADGTALFELCLDVTGEEGESSLIEMTDDPTPIEVTSGAMVLNYELDNGSLLVGDTACDLDTIAPIPICVGGINVVELVDGMVEIFAIDFDAGSLDNCTADADLRFTYSDVNPMDDPEFMSISSSRVFTEADLGSQIILDVYVWDEKDNKDYCRVLLELEEEQMMSDTVEFIFDEYFRSQGAELCVPLRVNNFTDVEAAQATVTWDNTVMTYVSSQNYNLPGFTPANINENNVLDGQLPFVWFDLTGQSPATLANGDALFEICFELTGAEGSSTELNLGNFPALIQVSSALTGVRPHKVIKGSVSILDIDCDFEESNIQWPLEQINVYIPDLDIMNISDLAAPTGLMSIVGIDSMDVYPIVTTADSCEHIIGMSYSDLIFDEGEGKFRIERDWAVVNWISGEVFGFSQIIKNYVDEGMICDTLPNSAPVGDCDSGHSLDDDVEWPDDIVVSDPRIDPEELYYLLFVDYPDTRPDFYNYPYLYNASYEDQVVSETSSEVVIERLWTVSHTVLINKQWNYVQTIRVDISSFTDLVLVNTVLPRPVPGVDLNAGTVTDIDGKAYTSDDIEAIKQDVSRNGINVKDLMRIRSGVLGQIEWSDYEEEIADLNGSQGVTTLDLVLMESIILDQEHDLSSEWVFIDKTLDIDAAIRPKAQLLAYKPGDVDDSADLGTGVMSYESDSLIIDDQMFLAGETYQVALYMESPFTAIATELHMYFDTNRIELSNVAVENIFDNISFEQSGESLHLISYGTNVEEAQVDPSSPFLIIELRALVDGTLAQSMGLDEDMASYMLTSEYELIEMNEAYQNVINTGLDDVLLNDVFEVYPNPAKDQLVIKRKSESMARQLYFELFSTKGERLLRSAVQGKVDLINIDPGMYIYRIWDGDKFQTAKLVITD